VLSSLAELSCRSLGRIPLMANGTHVPAFPPASPRSGGEQVSPGPATPNGHRNSSFDWDFPFPLPGRWQGKKRIPANTQRLQPWVDIDAYDATRIPPRFVKSPVSAEDLMRHIRTFADDVGLVSIDHPA